MSWMQKLSETYPVCVAMAERLGVPPPWPISHFVKRAHVEVVVDERGSLKRIGKLDASDSFTLVPATESSAGRTAGIAPHPLLEEIGYCARDFPERHIDKWFRYLADARHWSHSCVQLVSDDQREKVAKVGTEAGRLEAWSAGLDGAEQDETPDSEKAPKTAILLTLVAELNGVPPEVPPPQPFSEFKDDVMRLVRKHQLYMNQLQDWAESSYSHPKLKAIHAYLSKGTLWADMQTAKLLPFTFTGADGKKTKVDDDKIFVRWRVETVGKPGSGTWEDPMLVRAWSEFDAARNLRTGFDMTSGKLTRLAQSHPRFIRFPGDGGKLISANDFNGFTFRGRFTDKKDAYEKQACSVSYEVSQKAHSALRWLIERQGYTYDDQAVVAWAVSGKSVPDPFANTLAQFGDVSDGIDDLVGDTDQTFALRLAKAIAGYRSRLDHSDDVVVMALDSATPGRAAITYYRELSGSEFLDRIECWHKTCAWLQDFGKESRFVGAPAPRDIAEAAYGRRLDDKLRKSTVERLLPCIVDAQPIPRDLVESAVRRVCNRVALDKWEWEKCLGIACALFRSFQNSRSYQMSLEEDRVSRDYLYGRLLAIADSIESYALSMTEESKKRETTAARMMQRFAERPFSTWRNVELSLAPYRARLQAGSEKSAAFLNKRKRQLDEVMALLDSVADRTSDAPLTGEFLLGYHCQRRVFWPTSSAATAEAEGDDETAA